MLLDTCALLWLARGGDELSAAARRCVVRAPTLHVSAISGFEIGLKHARRKLELPVPPAEWLETVVRHHGLGVVPLSLEACIASTELPPIHRDPCDRFIIATARLHGWPVITADPAFAQYGVEVIW